VDTLLAARYELKRARKFDEADVAQASLRALGVEVDDSELTWRFNEAKAQAAQAA